ncbi:hypothetical protein ARMGADRAFT_1080253 [Armillaria gallica]|uniref:Uncharacterized protein n=1 Tax=Armillaria gallica TaxID=47427 RepID=A0A2H3DCW2_ARMGA|nr:hypothetical protein ARMGADRAFT_1080253 [Armillaria gallica]
MKTTGNDDKSGGNNNNGDNDDNSDNDDNDGDDGNNNNNVGGNDNNIGNNNGSGSSDETMVTVVCWGWIGYRYSVWPHEDDAPPTTELAANSKTTRLDATVNVHGCPRSILFESITSPDPHRTSYHPPFPVPAPIHDWTAGIF